MLSHMPPMTDFGELAETNLRSLPPAALAVVAAVMVGGLLMWAFGGRLVKPMYAFLFGIGGAAAGLFLPAALSFDMNLYVGVGLGAAIGVLAGILLFRLSMATALGAACGVLAPLIAGAVMWLGPADEPRSGSPLSLQELFLADVPVEEKGAAAEAPANEEIGQDVLDVFFSLDNGGETSDNAISDAVMDEAAEAARELAVSAARRTQAFVNELSKEAKAGWDELPEDQQLVLAVSAGLGALCGFLLGLSFPKKVAAAGSAFLGAGLWTPIAVKLIRDFAVPGAGSLPDTARGWLALWLVIAGIGLALQWTVLKPKADTTSRSE